jgi:uncharacterized protein (TIGR03067 family)
MSTRHCSLLALALIAATSALHAQAPSVAAPAEILGRWALIAVLRNAEDVTRFGMTQDGPVSVYDFKSDGTFSIMRDSTVIETGTWSANASAAPKTFDHIPNVDGRPGRFVPGIYESGGGVLKICMLPPSESNARPTKCEAKPENRSRIYIMMREAR